MQPKRPRRIEHPSPWATAKAGSPTPRPRKTATQRPVPPVDRRAAPEPEEPGLVRLSKRMAALGLCSRREADEWIEKGWVRVDGERVTQLGTRTLPGQKITIDRAARAEQEQRATILLHKPIGYVSGQAEDGHRPASVLVEARTQWKDDPSGIAFRPAHLRGLAPAGRLDIDSTGLLVLTQDGRIARQLIGADSSIEKEYLVRVQGSLDADGLARLQHGLALDGVPLKRAEVAWLNDDQLRFVLTEGRNRQVRRMCELVGLKVLALKRVRIGRVMLGHLPRGQWRFLAPDERF
jgi:23S rRNA pseudouridine2604 synthase